MVLLIYLLLSFGAGRIFRFPFNDDTYDLAEIHRNLRAYLSFATSVVDVHPNLSYLLFSYTSCIF